MNAPIDVTDARERLLSGIPVTERRLELAGISTLVLEGGGGPPMVLLHGPAQHAAKWFKIIPGLIASDRVIAPDLPGHGATVVREGGLDAERVFAWLGELIERTCPIPPTLVGQVVGGAMAARFAALHPEGIRGLVLVDTLGLVPFRPAPEFERALMAFITRPGDDTYDHLWERCAFDLDLTRERMGEKWEWLKTYSVERARVPALQAEQQALMAEFGFPAIAAEDLARITVPTTLIWGRHDLATRLQVAETASARYGWALHIIENAGADADLEEPEAFLAALRTAQRETVASATAV
jgi:pimeloyl-ACP methyl ester carboxylesterase